MLCYVMLYILMRCRRRTFAIPTTATMRASEPFLSASAFSAVKSGLTPRPSSRARFEVSLVASLGSGSEADEERNKKVGWVLRR